MKRLIIFLSLVLSVLIVYAKPPQLAVEKLFDGKYNKEKGVSTSIYRNGDSYYRGLTVDDNPALIKKMAEAVDKDAARASSYFENTNEDGKFTALKISSNGETIDIGFKEDSRGTSAYLYIKGSEKAFK